MNMLGKRRFLINCVNLSSNEIQNESLQPRLRSNETKSKEFQYYWKKEHQNQNEKKYISKTVRASFNSSSSAFNGYCAAFGRFCGHLISALEEKPLNFRAAEINFRIFSISKSIASGNWNFTKLLFVVAFGKCVISAVATDVRNK